MIVEGLVLLGAFGLYQIDKSTRIDAEAKKTNISAFTQSVEAQKKLELCNKRTFQILEVNAKRKQGLLTCHLKMFQEQYKVIQQIQFKRGRGIEELEKMDEIRQQVARFSMLPELSRGRTLTDIQTLVSIALRGIGGYMVMESKSNLQLANLNLSESAAYTAEVDTICIALNGIAEHTELTTKLLEKIGMLYMKSIKNLTQILSQNGMDEDNYTDEDIDAINLALTLTKVVYRIINTPMVDQNGKIERESYKVIHEGEQLLKQIGAAK